MPTGVITNCMSVFCGALMGSIVGKRLSDSYKKAITLILGLSAISIGITNLIKVVNMPPIILSITIGTAIGNALKLETAITKGFGYIIDKVFSGKNTVDLSSYVTVAVLFCCSGFGIFGVITEGLSGDPSVLVSKSILDFCTAFIFAGSLGISVCLIVIPQIIIFSGLFFLSQAAGAFITTSVLMDFIACGGILTIAAGFRIAKIKEFYIADMIPSLILVFLLSSLWK